ncbi:MAG: tetratricopeptide repeat protein, partial [Nitrospirae bacterium]|nr:tetratricopeptide repeat protein [Candidatus Troglogloeales bacterium]
LHKIDPLGEYRKIAEEKNDASRLPAAPVEFSPVLNIAAGDLSLESIRETDIGTFSEGIDLQGMRALGATRAPVIDESLEESFDLASALTKELDDLSANALAIPHGGSEPIPSSSGEGVQNEKKQQYLETCYHLGIAQKEMGNYTKAIREFEQALAGAGRFQEVLSMLASCYAEQGDLAHAAAVLQEGLNDSRCQGDARLAILYDLASIHEQLGEKEKSFPLYKEIYRVNPKFRDVSGKVKEIPYRKPSPGSPESIRAKEAALFASEEAGVKDKAMAPIVKQKRRVSYV